MGQQLGNSRRGFPVATPEDALWLTPWRRVSGSCVAIIKGIANGLGCVQGPLLYMPFFRPVYPVDLTMTHCSWKSVDKMFFVRQLDKTGSSDLDTICAE
jgi:hypothetical protein